MPGPSPSPNIVLETVTSIVEKIITNEQNNTSTKKCVDNK